MTKQLKDRFNRTKLEKFLTYTAVFFVFSFIISMMMISFFYRADPDSFCYEVSDPVFVYNGDDVFGESITNCTLISNEDFVAVDNYYTWLKLKAFFLIVGVFAFLPEFRQKIGVLIKSFSSK